MIIFCPKDGGSWSVDLSGVGSYSFFVLGWRGLKKCRPPPLLRIFFWNSPQRQNFASTLTKN